MKSIFWKKEKGQALVEFALIIPLLLLMLCGVVEFGRIFGAQLAVMNGSREGARLGAVQGEDSAIVLKVQECSIGIDSDQLVINIQPEEADRKSGGEVRVEVSYPVPIIAPFISAITGNIVNVEATSVMRVE